MMCCVLLCLLEVCCVPLRIVEAVEGGLSLLEVPEVMQRVLLCTLGGRGG